FYNSSILGFLQTQENKMHCGLLTNKDEPVPLKHIEVDLQVQGHVATVTSTLQYVNEEENTVEAVFVFPMLSGAALCHFSAKIADQEIVAEVQEKEEAREQYDDALSSGQQAFLLEESEESVDVFRLSVGSLPPHQNAAVTFIYIIELSVQADHSLQFCLPAVLNPRYSPAGAGGGIVSEITSSSAGVPYSLNFNAHVSSPNPITKVESKCPLEPLTFLNTEHTKAKVSLTAGHKFDRDVELYVYYQNPHQLTAVVEAGAPTAQPGTLMGDPAVMVSFYPEFPQSVMSSTSSCGEFVFVMDRSGSMGCQMHNGQGAQERIMCARDTLLLMLKSLPLDCYFNIYGFGSHFESFFPKSVQYNQDTLDQAVKKVNEMQADMGGTEILQPLEHIYKQPCIPNHPRQLFIFTDGEVGNTRDVLHCVRSNADFHRCFSFGIGEGASTALITGLAENGSGHAQFITATERMQAKVMQSLRYALQPAVTDITEDWTGLSFTRLSPPLKALFHGQRALIYAQLKGEECQKPDAMGKIAVQYRLGDQEVSNTVHFSMKPAEGSGLAIHRLGARSLIRSLERKEQDDGADKEALKSRVVELSKQSGVSSSHTAFIAVNKGSGQAVKGPVVTRRIPTMIMMQCQMAKLPPCPVLLCGPAPMAAPMAAPQYCSYAMDAAVSAMVECDGAFGVSPDLVLSDSNTGFVPQPFGASHIQKNSETPKDLLLQLVSLQKASGCWEMEPALAEVFGRTEKELIEQIPAQVKPDVWATFLALIWLHGFKIDAQVEWEFLSMKAVAWIRTQKVPLKHIEVDLQVQGHVVTVTSTLQYINEEERPLEAVFVFPMPSGAALCHFSAKIADQEIVAEVKEKQEAQELYDDALSSGQQAFLLEGSKQSLDVFRLSVGSLPPHQSAAVTFIYIIELSVQADHSLQFCLPAVLNPRYSPAGTGGGIVSEITSSSAGVPYSLSFTAHVSSPNPIAKVESKCPLEPLTFLNTEHTKAKVSLTAGHKFDRDVELYVYYQNPHQLTAIVEAGAPTAQPGTLMGDLAVMVSFYPEFPESVMSSTSSCGEFVFVMDRSGSMGCRMYNGQHVQQRIMCARDTLLLLLKSLPMGCYFNIYGFGSHFKSFFPKSVQYSQDTMDQAVKKVNEMQSDMGGTEILRPLEHIYKQPCIPNHPRQLFIFTDGEVGNTRDVLHCVRRNADFHRCFSFGIGEGASSALITGLAENGSGHAQFITGTERLQAKVMQSLRFALQPVVTDITEDWTGLSFTRLSPPIKSLFHAQRALIYAQMKGEECQKPDAMGKITVQYRIGDVEVSNTVHFSRKPAEDSGLSIHRLGARSLIRSLEREEQDDGADKEALKARVVELSKQSGVSSSHTAFIAVNKGSGQAVKGPVVTRRIPTPMMMQQQGMNMSQMMMQQQGMNMSQMMMQQQGMNMSQ
ncbi:von Willebrand factor A domain-containing protein 5A-like isoform X1, partial [Clarias magur]